ncbi:MAG TPA: GNAT family N-acetyltransferase [Bryobacterales bacterium]|nr:GNAT family N-acetyltransferase [Bryobacterales bacterium]
MTIESMQLIPASAESDWNRAIETTPHDFYHTAAYHRFSQDCGEGEAFLAVYGSARRYLAWPYLLRPLGSGELRDVTSVYGYAGPLAFGCAPGDPFLDRARDRIGRLWLSQKVVTVFTRFHPLLENHRWAEGAPWEPPLRAPLVPGGGVHAGGVSVSIDLTRPEAATWHDYQSGLRNRIHHGRRLGLASEIDEGWSHLEDFVRFYHATMERNHALSYYFFSLDYFRRLRQALGAHAFLLLARLGGEIAAAGIFIEYAGSVQNHFCVNNEQYLRLAPSKVLLDDVRRWAQERGNHVFHLGGGRGGRQDSLFGFKAAFSRRRHLFYTGRWILDPIAYHALCAGIRAAPDFFPAYRAPLAGQEGLRAI